MRRFLPVGLALGAFFLGACGGDDAGTARDEQTPPATITPRVDEMRAALRPVYLAYCEHATRCCNDDEFALQLGPVTDPGECADRILDRAELGNADLPDVAARGGQGWRPTSSLVNLLYQLTELQYALDEARTELNEGALEACAEYVSDQACGAAPPPEHCEATAPRTGADPCAFGALFTGKVAEGSECEDGSVSQCEAGLTCRYLRSSLGVCTPMSTKGSPCTGDWECLSPLVCNWTTAECDDASAFGKPCAFTDLQNPLPRTETQRCQVNLACDPVSSKCTAASCVAGMSCSWDRECPEGLSCVNGRCGELAGPGESCNGEDADCKEGRCVYSQSAQRWACTAPRPNGEPCSQDEDCTSKFCDATSPAPACGATRSNGTECGWDAECTSGRCKYDDTLGLSACSAEASLGAACTDNIDCAGRSQNQCVASFCRATRLEDGEACEEAVQCSSGSCTLSKCGPGQAGAPCSASAPCAPAFYCPLDDAEPTCTSKKPFAAPCSSNDECWGSCGGYFGVARCDGANPAAAVCGGE